MAEPAGALWEGGQGSREVRARSRPFNARRDGGVCLVKMEGRQATRPHGGRHRMNREAGGTGPEQGGGRWPLEPDPPLPPG